MWPGQLCGDVAHVLNRNGPLTHGGRSSNRSCSTYRLVVLVAGIASAAPDRKLQHIASPLEGMRERTPRGRPRCTPHQSATCCGGQNAWGCLAPPPLPLRRTDTRDRRQRPLGVTA